MYFGTITEKSSIMNGSAGFLFKQIQVSQLFDFFLNGAIQMYLPILKKTKWKNQMKFLPCWIGPMAKCWYISSADVKGYMRHFLKKSGCYHSRKKRNYINVLKFFLFQRIILGLFFEIRKSKNLYLLVFCQKIMSENCKKSHLTNPATSVTSYSVWTCISLLLNPIYESAQKRFMWLLSKNTSQ